MKNPVYNRRGTIDGIIEVNEEELPTTVAPGDDLYDKAMAGEFGPVADYVPPVVTAQDAYNRKNVEIKQWLDRELSGITSRYSGAEQLTWEVQIREAHLFLLDKSAETPFLDTISAVRERDKTELARAIIKRRNVMMGLIAQKLGKAQKCRDMADKFLDEDNVEAIKNIIPA